MTKRAANKDFKITMINVFLETEKEMNKIK
jgi:hypothetical protein